MNALSNKILIALAGVALATLSVAPPAMAADHSKKDSPVPFDEYTVWPTALKIAYDKELRSIYSEFELSAQEGMKFSANTLPLRFLDLMPKAFAEGNAHVCLLGGVQLKMILSPGTMDMYYCPSERPCGSHSDGGYQCGTIYNDECVAREPKSTITRRCISAAGDALPSKERYEAKRAAIASIAVECNSDVVDKR